MKTRTPESLQEPLLGLTGYVLRRASTAALGEFSQKLASVDLRPTDAALLVLLDAAPEVTHSEAAETLGLRRPNLVPVVAGLEKVSMPVVALPTVSPLTKPVTIPSKAGLAAP